MAKSKKSKSQSAPDFMTRRKKRLSFLTEIEPKKMIVFPLIVFILALLTIAIHPPIMGIEFEGGIVVIADGVSADPDELAKEISSAIGVDVRVEKYTGLETSGVRIYAPVGTNANDIVQFLEKKYPGVSPVPSEVHPTFGEMAKRQGLRAIVMAFLAMAVVVFLFFRDVVPSMTIIFSALSDMVIAVAFMSILGIEVTTATIAALLMLIGYTVDSNILLTTKLLRRKEDTVEEAYLSAVSTGVTMSSTTLGALLALWLISTSQTIDNIAMVLIFGLLADFMNTWILNAGVLRWYLAFKASRGDRA